MLLKHWNFTSVLNWTIPYPIPLIPLNETQPYILYKLYPVEMNWRCNNHNELFHKTWSKMTQDGVDCRELFNPFRFPPLYRFSMRQHPTLNYHPLMLHNNTIRDIFRLSKNASHTCKNCPLFHQDIFFQIWYNFISQLFYKKLMDKMNSPQKGLLQCKLKDLIIDRFDAKLTKMIQKPHPKFHFNVPNTNLNCSSRCIIYC